MTAKRSIEQLKRDAKRLKKAEGISHTEALNRVVQQYGFKTWDQFLASKDIKDHSR